MRTTTLSQQVYGEAQRVLVGGVNSPVRAFQSVGGNPIIVEKGKGSRIYDVDGNEYIDYLASWGPLILGHAHPAVLSAIRDTAARGTSFGATTALEVEMGTMVAEAFPSIDLVRFVNSGTEAVLSALRLARAYTRRSKIVKFAGCYHGHSDALLVEAGSGVLTLGIPGSEGVPAHVAQDTIVVPYNDEECLQQVFQQCPDDIAAVIVEPIAGNMGLVLPEDGWLQSLRSVTAQYGALLIFDEVITGFRCTYGGVQSLYGVQPDITCLGKIIGGGMPVGAYGGKREIMEMVAPLGGVYQAGTLSGNPVAMAAGIATLKELRYTNPYDKLALAAQTLCDAMERAARDKGIPMRINRYGSLFTPFFVDSDVVDYATARRASTQTYARFFWTLTNLGLFVPPSQFEAWFVSTAHTPLDIQITTDLLTKAIHAL